MRPARILGEIEIADEADQGRQRATRLVAKHIFDFEGGQEVTSIMPGCHQGSSRSRNDGIAIIDPIGRTSIEPVFAPGIRAAMASALSRSLASIR